MLDQLLALIHKFMRPKDQLLQDGKVWHCSKCNLLFLSEKEGHEHACKEADAVR